MGVSTKSTFYSIESTVVVKKEIQKALINEFGIDLLECNHEDESFGFIIHATLDFNSEQFTDKKEHRIIYFFNDGYAEYRMNTGMWGHSERIAKAIVNHFGGFADYCDSDNVNIDYCKSQFESRLGVKIE